MQEGAYLYAFSEMDNKPAFIITIILIIVLSIVIGWTFFIGFYGFGIFLLIFDIILIGCAIYLYKH